jgi:hypothetical protein
MIYIEQNAVNNIFVNVSQYKTGNYGANPKYLWRLQNAQGRNIVSFYPENSTSTYPSAYTGRYDVFTFNTFKNQPENYIYSAGTDCNLHLVNENQYWLGIYEMPPNSTSLNPSGEKLLNSLAFIFVPVENEFYTGNTANFEPNKIYYKNGDGITPTPSNTASPTPTPTNTGTPTPTPTNTQTPTITPSATPLPCNLYQIRQNTCCYVGTLSWTDCNNIPQTFTYGGSNFPSNKVICAKQGSVVLSSGLTGGTTINLVGEAGSACKEYFVSGSTFSGVSATMTFTDCGGNPQTEVIPGGGSGILYAFCGEPCSISFGNQFSQAVNLTLVDNGIC